MRVLVVHRYYWPDEAPCAGIMRWVARHLAAEGNEVSVLTSQPSYRQRMPSQIHPRSSVLDGVHVLRLNLPTETGRLHWRIINALYLGLWILFKAIFNRYDLIIVATVPPVLGGFFSALAAKLTKARFIYYCMDLHPEIGRVSGDFSNPFLFQALQRIDDWSCRQADPVLVHSQDMLDTLRSRPRGKQYNLEIMNNFALPAEHAVLPPSIPDLQASNNRLTLIYAGNIGRFQGLDTVLNAMGLIAGRKDIELVLLGDGVAKQDLIEQQQQNQANVRFLDYQPVEVAKRIIGAADVGLVTLIPEMYRYAYPSKTMTYLEQGIPIIAAVEAESELAKTMRVDGYGFSVPIGDACALADILIKLADDVSWKTRMGGAAKAAFETYFSAPLVLAKWSNVVRTGHVLDGIIE